MLRSVCLSLLLAFTALGDPWDFAAPAEITPQTYRERRAELIRSYPPHTLFVMAGAASLGELYPFRQSSDYYYLTGVSEAGGVLVLYHGVEGPEEWLFLPARDRNREVWEGPRLAPGEQSAALLGFAAVLSREELTARVEGLLETATAVVSCQRTEGWGRADPRENFARYTSLADAIDASGLELGNAAGKLGAMRLVKSPGEIARLRQAIGVTGEGLVDGMRAVRAGMPEFQLEAVIEFAFFRGGAERVGFPSIVGAGENSCVLHYNLNRAGSKDGDLVVCDVGAEFGMYTADVTRTFPVNGRFTPRQRELYEIVLAAQQAGIDACKPGATVNQIHRAASAVIREAGYGRYFMHGTSHWLGLDVHDVGDYDTPLAPGMVLTVEPGIYIAGEELGIRIEDDVLITEDGHEVLSGHIPRSVEAIESLMRGEDAPGDTPDWF